MPTSPFYPNYINGAWQSANPSETFESYNPAQPNVSIGTFQASTAEAINQAVLAAKQAFPAWKALPAPKRGELFFKLAAYIATKKEAWATEMATEMGKPYAEALGDVQEAIEMATFMGGEGRRLHGFQTPSEFPNKWLMAIRQPIGVCGIITPWNFPIAVPSWKLFPAIIAGNTVVFKPAEQSPLMGFRMAEAFDAVGFPAGVINLVQGNEVAGKAIVNHADVGLISFTGSTATGTWIATRCAEQHKLCALELGGKNACIVWEDANLDLAIEGLLWGAFGTAGQRCTATSRLIVHRSVKKAVVEGLLAKIPSLKIGNPSLVATQVGPLIDTDAVAKVQRMVATALTQGATLLCGGKRFTEPPLHEGFYFQPTVLDDVVPTMEIAQEEVFGPVLSVITVDSLEEAVAIANGVRYGLSAAIYSQDMGLAMGVVEQLEAGLTYINAPTIGAETHVPFGGVKQSGNGHREASNLVLDTYTQWKTISIETTRTLRKAQMD
ncbi:MAG: aldehyde dehydrogenase family protein [Candidatus Melainabacteria bacterium]|nr:aldehyde dehydrogenase family protein [Candidatus Melainabacteria bacterium]